MTTVCKLTHLFHFSEDFCVCLSQTPYFLIPVPNMVQNHPFCMRSRGKAWPGAPNVYRCKSTFQTEHNGAGWEEFQSSCSKMIDIGNIWWQLCAPWEGQSTFTQFEASYAFELCLAIKTNRIYVDLYALWIWVGLSPRSFPFYILNSNHFLQATHKCTHTRIHARTHTHCHPHVLHLSIEFGAIGLRRSWWGISVNLPHPSIGTILCAQRWCCLSSFLGY